MPDFPKLPIIQPPPDQKQKPNESQNPFPELTIVTPDPPRLTLQEKYGSLLYLGIAGLVISLALVAQFVQALWSTRDIWYAVYALNDPSKPMAERIESAWVIARSPSANDSQRLQMALRKELPPLARYIVAEGMTSDSIRSDTKAYALMVAKSEGWPPWLRLMIARPMAYGVGEGYQIAWEPLDLLRQSEDPALALLATYTKAVMLPGDPQADKSLSEFAGKEGLFQPFAKLLETASKLESEARVQKLDEATRWLRTHHPGAKLLWEGWEERNGKLAPTTSSTIPEPKSP
jgi:hypothetical protein